MPEESKNNTFSFKQFLESNTNLLTVFAIFNALIIFSVGIKENEIIRDILTISFWIFSLLTFLELLLTTTKSFFTYRDNISWGGKIKLSLFLYAVIFAQMSLVAYFILLYPFVFGYALIFLLTIGVFVSFVWIHISVVDKVISILKKRGSSERTIMVAKKIGNWSLLYLPIVIAVITIYIYWMAKK